jgi:hypothetical protein
VRDFQITINYHEKKTRDAFGFLRFALAKDAEMVMATGHRGDQFRAEDVDPLSITNEQVFRRVLFAI